MPQKSQTKATGKKPAAKAAPKASTKAEKKPAKLDLKGLAASVKAGKSKIKPKEAKSGGSIRG